MFAIHEQFLNAIKSDLESRLSIISSLNNNALEGIEKLAELNVTAAKSSLSESIVAARELMSAKGQQEFFSLCAAQAPAAAQKAIAYGRQLMSIGVSAQGEFIKAAEAQIADTNRKVISLVDEVSKNAPAGSESMIAALKASIGTANAGYEQLTKSTKQTVEAIESNMSGAVHQYTVVAQKAAPKAA